MEKEIKLTENEINTLKFYMEKALIDAQGMQAIGFDCDKSITNIKSILEKVR